MDEFKIRKRDEAIAWARTWAERERASECLYKRKYQSRTKALAEVTKQRTKYGHKCSEYKCRWCGCWHLTCNEHHRTRLNR